MWPDPSSLLPSGKMETDKAEAIVALGYPKVGPILPALLEWMQDMNWPVARVLQPFLVGIGAPLAPHIRCVLGTNDEIWKYWVLRCIVAESTDLAQILRPELKRLACSPTKGEKTQELDIMVQRILGAARSSQ
jgi:hypothetical protein